MLSSVWVEIIFLISVLVHLKTAGDTSFFYFPLRNTCIHSEDLCPIRIFHWRQCELRDEVPKMHFHNKNDTEKHKSC